MNMTIACALMWEVTFVGVYSTGRGSPFMGKTFQVQEYTGGRHSLEAAIVKKARLWLCNHFLKDVWNELVLVCIFV